MRLWYGDGGRLERGAAALALGVQINANEEAIRLDPSIPSLAVGNPLPTGPTTGGDGLWTGAFDGGYVLRIGGALNSAPQLLYNGASGRLAFRSTTGTEMIVLDVDGSAYFGGPMTIATGGGIWQGTGTFASPTTGLKIYNAGGVGRLSTYNGGLEQIAINTAGQLTAGQGTTILDRNGVTIVVGETAADYRSIKFQSGASQFGRIAATYDSGSCLVEYKAQHPSSGVAALIYQTSQPQGGNSSIALNVGSAFVVLSQNDFSVTTPNRSIINSPRTLIEGDVGVAGGLALGDVTLDPLTGVLLMKERTSATTATPADTAQIWVQDVAGVQKFYIKFANGVQRELATA
jgi:hypothetical protein